jgi:alkylation response protein AidB-like acyl-CoA dehydrogenase
MSMFVCEKGDGVRAAKKIRTLGSKSIDIAELVFEDYRVPADQLVGGTEGQGFKQLMQTFVLQIYWEHCWHLVSKA